LINNQRGEWFVDTRLRLRGGGLSSRRKALQLKNRQRITELKKKLAQFSDERESARQQLMDAHAQMKAASDETRPSVQQQFLEKLDQHTDQYAAPLNN
jgi:chorismate mutase